ncbi:hypothetical protein BS50DRAFT_589756 [Corynespora cassiicola Philippines]|uniref:Uncharacterized protein n=1 Tax=Corynespora cassiicola Philippines TaxID=1448308 RepID=A0A2T2NIT6_CORCC|nr:hypothetical protein BS50DRAFT_589756 [Corynespora cassiicola Philippines]
MFFNSRSLFKAALVSAFMLEAGAIELKPISSPSDMFPPQNQRRANQPPAVELLPIEDPGVMFHGRSLKRELPRDACFKPHKENSFYWGAYAGDNIYVANFTLSALDEDDYILPVENFAKTLKSIKCGTPGEPMIIEFSDAESLKFAKESWKWIDDKDINHFTLVTEPDQCYPGDNRSPYVVSDIKFDENKLMATITAEEKPWEKVAKNFKLHVGHEYVNPATANVTHPHLKRAEGKTMDISHSFNANLFEYAKDSSETKGMALSADAEITTAGAIVADFDLEVALFIPKDLSIKISPQDVTADFILSLTADGTLGKALDWTMKPEIEIPIGAINIKKILEIGPFVTMGVHFGSSALEGTGTMKAGAKAKLSNDAHVDVKLRHPEENSIDGWKPEFEKIDPTFSAEIGGDVRAWGELGITIKAEAFGAWGYQVGVDAQLPYFQANMKGMYDDFGVCGTQKTLGVEINSDVGINVNLNAGKVDEAPDFQKDLFETSWPIFTTCIGVGDDNAKATDVPEPEPTEQPEPEPTEQPEPEPTEQPEPEPTEEPEPTDAPAEKGPVETPESAITDAPKPTVGPIMTGGGLVGTGTAGGSGSAGFPMTAANTTFLKMPRRMPSPTRLY